MQERAKMIRIHGQDVPVRAHVEVLDGLSAHADQSEIMRWLGGFKLAPRQVYVVHGEPDAAKTLASLIRQKLGWNAEMARDGATVSLEG
jgi:metallo-beta-lactamase family protein